MRNIALQLARLTISRYHPIPQIKLKLESVEKLQQVLFLQTESRQDFL